MNDKGPDLQRRAWSVAVALIVIGYGAHLIERWLVPLLPVVFVVLALLTLFRLLFRRR